MVRKTKGIVLRNVRYGETSLIVSILTETFGIQSYIINGVRTEKQGREMASRFSPASLLDLEVYYHEQRGINRIREASRFAILYYLEGDVIKNNIALFMMELLHKALKHPEQNRSLFIFCEQSLKMLDEANQRDLVAFPYYFALHLPHFLGFGISMAEEIMPENHEFHLDLANGCFTSMHPDHNHFISGQEARSAAFLLSGKFGQTGFPQNLPGMPEKFLDFYRLHIQDFGKIKSYTLLQELMS